MRWYLIEAIPPRWCGADLLDGDEYVNCGFATRHGARRLARRLTAQQSTIPVHLRTSWHAMRRRRWLIEHEA